MASDFEKHNNSIFAPMAKAFTDLRVEKRLKIDKIVMDTGIAKSTICSFVTLKHAMNIDTFLRLLDYMDIDMYDIALRMTKYNHDEMQQRLDQDRIRCKIEAENQDKIFSNRVMD